MSQEEREQEWSAMQEQASESAQELQVAAEGVAETQGTLTGQERPQEITARDSVAEDVDEGPGGDAAVS